MPALFPFLRLVTSHPTQFSLIGSSCELFLKICTSQSLPYDRIDNMSASDPHIAAATGSVASDTWQQHESQIRDLYQNKKKTLKQVKEEMENRGFPKKP